MDNFYHIALSAGDDVGAELISQTLKVLHKLEEVSDARFELRELLTCGPAVEKYGVSLPEETVAAAEDCCAFMFGNIGSGTDAMTENQMPAHALIEIRRLFKVCANLRPVYSCPGLEELSPLKSELINKGIDLLFVRDLSGGMIPGHKKHGMGPFGEEASDKEYYNEEMIDNSAHIAFNAAAGRRRKVLSVDKANVLESGKLWRSKVKLIAEQYPGVEVSHDFVDHTAMELLRVPDEFDVLLTSNTFGDILSDEASQLTGTPNLYGSAELAKDMRGVYTPNQLHHPRGKELEGKGIVSPYGILNATAMLLRYSCGREDLAQKLENAILKAIADGLFTAEFAPEGAKILSTDELGQAIADRI